MSDAHLLLVEDDPGDVLLAMSVLRKLQFADRVDVVNDGVEAMAYLNAPRQSAHRTSLPRFILLDLKLPRVNGFELLEQITAHDVFKHIPVVVLTSSNQPSDIERAYRLGVNGYVVKNIDFNLYAASLRAVVEYWLNANEPSPTLIQCGAVRRRIKTQTVARPIMAMWRSVRVAYSYDSLIGLFRLGGAARLT